MADTRKCARTGVAVVAVTAAVLCVPQLLAQQAIPSWDGLRAVYDYDADLALNAELGEGEPVGDVVSYSLHFDSINDERVPAALFLPRNADAPVGAALILHGYGGSKDDVAVQLVARTLASNGVAAIAIDAQYHGERRQADAEFFSTDLPRVGEAIVQTVVDNRRAIDYLWSRDDIDRDRIALLGVSMGAILGSIVAAVDERICSACLVVGGGRWELLAEQSTHPVAATLRAALSSPEAQALIAFVDPVHFVGHISPRPTLMLNGREDQIVPSRCAQALHEAAQEPKQIVWYDGGHIPDPLTAMTVLGRWMRDTFGTAPAEVEATE